MKNLLPWSILVIMGLILGAILLVPPDIWIRSSLRLTAKQEPEEKRIARYRQEDAEATALLVREALADRYYRNGTIWSPFVLQLMTEDIAEESGIELNSEVPHDDFFLLYDGEPLIASSFWPRSDDSDDEV